MLEDIIPIGFLAASFEGFAVVGLGMGRGILFDDLGLQHAKNI